MASVQMKAGNQLTEMRVVQNLNFLDAGLTAAQVEPLHTTGLPEFRDAVRALFDLVDGGIPIVDKSNYPDDGDSVRTTRDKINWTWANVT